MKIFKARFPFQDLSGFLESNLSISSRYSGRAFHSASIDLLRLFLQLIPILKETPETFENPWNASKQDFFCTFQGFQNRISLWALHILVEHWILHRLMCWLSFCNGYLSWKKLLKHLKMHESVRIKIFFFEFLTIFKIESLYVTYMF